MHEEAEHEVVASEPADEAGEALAGAQPAAQLADHLLADGVVAHEGDAAAGEHVARGRLADVVQQRAEAQRLGAGELVAERLGQDPLDARGLLGAEQLRQPLLQLDLPGQHLERVVVDVEVVVVALLDPVEGGQLGQDRLEHAEAVGQLQPGEGAVRDHQPAQLSEHALAGGARHARRGRAR